MTEELANTVTHGFGALLGVAATAWLVAAAALGGDPWVITSVSVYGATLIALLGATTAYHATWHPDWKRWLRVLDHACIYLLIAGTYTPFTLVALRGPWGWSLFGVVWGLALAGVVAKLFFTGRFEALSVALYVVMGWAGVVAARPLVAALPTEGVAWLVAGGVAYTGGVAFYVWERLPYSHALWHLAVLVGAGCHVLAVRTLLGA